METKCPFCDYFVALRKLGKHASFHHQIGPKQLFMRLESLSEEPVCSCGCGEPTRFISVVEGFAKYRRGHYAKINNPHVFRTEETFKKVSQTRLEKFSTGEIAVWNKGLDMSDPRVASNAEKSQRTIQSNPVERARRSEAMRNDRRNGTIPTLHGERHSRWKGGSSGISARCHGSRRLFQEWKYPHLVRAGFKCERCGSTTRLEVHHNGEKMSEIIHKFVQKINPDKKNDFALHTTIVEKVVEYHIDNCLVGEVICHDCHKEEHPLYNF